MFAEFIFLAALFFLGWIILGHFGSHLSGLEKIGLAYGTGAGFFTLAVFLASIFGLSVSLMTGVGTYAILFGTSAILLRHRHWKLATRESVKCTFPSVYELALLGLIAASVSVVFVIAAFWPPYAWDGLAFWLLRGKLIATTDSLSLLKLSWNASYPLNLSLQAGYLYLLGGTFVQAIFPIYFGSIALVFYANLRHFASRTITLGCTLFLVSVPYLTSQATIAYGNVPFALYYVGSSIYLFRYLREKRVSFLILSGILVGLAGWTRFEAPLYCVTNLLVLLIFDEKTRVLVGRMITYGGTFLVFYAPWAVFAKVAGLGDFSGSAMGGLTDIASGHLDMALLAQIFSFWRQSIANTQQWGWLWLAFPVALIIGVPLRRHAPLITLISLNLVELFYTYYSAAANSPNSITWWLSTGFDRMMLHWSPLIVFYLGLTLGTLAFYEDIIT